MLLLAAAIPLLHAPSAASIYAQCQRKLDALPRISVGWLLSNGDHMATVIYERPKRMGYVSYGDYGFRTDGRFARYKDEKGKVVRRPLRQGDLQRFEILGFESFHRPRRLPQPTGEAVTVMYGDRPCWRVTMGAPSDPGAFLYIDQKTLLPAGHNDVSYFTDIQPTIASGFFK